ncbi:MAG: hypothetical protein KGY55_02135 [Candidatus Thermoplasmatota archaeon]|nr:hypothetical protein [Candidatus Thermoplasmatota archaeon]
MNRRGYLYLLFIGAVIVLAAFLLFMRGGGDDEAEARMVISDWDPLVDVEVIFRIDRIRTLDFQRGESPLYAMDVTIGGRTIEGVGAWGGIDAYPRWRHVQDVDDGEENVTVTVRLYEIVGDEQVEADISPGQGTGRGQTLHLTYSLRTGRWWGDDRLHDKNGLGHVSGAEDGSLDENDCELWFSIYQTDADGDRLTWYEETYIYGTDPAVDNTGDDMDGDGVPIEWEDTWGYSPLRADNHSTLDPDGDGIQNTEEYRMAFWRADPFRQDVFVEVDYMENQFFGHTTLPEYSKQKVISAFSRQNIMLHVDDGLMGGGGEVLPFEKFYTPEKLAAYYDQFFLHDGAEAWREDVFRYAVMAYYTIEGKRNVAGYSYWHDRTDQFNSFVVARRAIKNYRFTPMARDTATASLFMHELGHTLGLFWHTYNGIDNTTNIYPWLSGWDIYENYRSCMNYRYAWGLIDYSDGSHGEGDFDDWSRVDPAFFETQFFAEPPIIL